MTNEEAKQILIGLIQIRKNSTYNEAILKAIEALDLEIALGKVIDHWRNNE